MQQIPIPQHINAQIQFLWWELDEFIVFIACFIGGEAAGSYYTLISLFVGFMVVKWFRRYKLGHMEGILYHLMYANGICPLNKRYQDGLQTFYKF